MLIRWRVRCIRLNVCWFSSVIRQSPCSEMFDALCLHWFKFSSCHTRLVFLSPVFGLFCCVNHPVFTASTRNITMHPKIPDLKVERELKRGSFSMTTDIQSKMKTLCHGLRKYQKFAFEYPGILPLCSNGLIKYHIVAALFALSVTKEDYSNRFCVCVWKDCHISFFWRFNTKKSQLWFLLQPIKVSPMFVFFVVCNLKKTMKGGCFAFLCMFGAFLSVR